MEAVEQNLTIQEACKLARNSRNKTLFLAVSQQAPIADKPDHVFPIYAHVKLSAPAICKFIESAYRNFGARGALVRVTIMDNCIFFGG